MMLFTCTQCKCVCSECKPIGNMFTCDNNAPQIVNACSLQCVLRLRVKSMYMSRKLMLQFMNYTKRNKKFEALLENKLLCLPTRSNEKIFRRFAILCLKEVPIYDENIFSGEIETIGRVLQQ
jgi:hypothetical protein